MESCKSAPPTILNKKETSNHSSLASSSLSNEVNNKVISITKRTNSNENNKYQLTITSERLAELKKKVEEALKDHKTFTIKGTFFLFKSKY